LFVPQTQRDGDADSEEEAEDGLLCSHPAAETPLLPRASRHGQAYELFSIFSFFFFFFFSFFFFFFFFFFLFMLGTVSTPAAPSPWRRRQQLWWS
jgi:hypothetical protein